MKTLLLFLALLPAALFGQAVSRNELRNTNDILLSKINSSSNSLFRFSVPTNNIDVAREYNFDLQAAWNANPNGHFILQPGLYPVTNIYGLTNPVGSTSPIFEGVIYQNAGSSGARIVRRGSVTNGTLVDLDSLYNAHFKRISFETYHTNADRVLISIDKIKGGGNMTRWRFEECDFYTSNEDPRHVYRAFQVSSNSPDNCEDGAWIDCYWQGGDGNPGFTNNSFGLWIGNSANVLNLKVVRGWATYFTNFLHSLNGQIEISDMELTANSVDFAVHGNNSPTILRNNHSEAFRQHVVAGSNRSAVVILDAPRIGTQATWSTNYGILENRGANPILLRNIDMTGQRPLQPAITNIGSGYSAAYIVDGWSRFTTNNDYHALINAGVLAFELDSLSYGGHISGSGGQANSSVNGGYGFGAWANATPIFIRARTNNSGIYGLVVEGGNPTWYVPSSFSTGSVEAASFIFHTPGNVFGFYTNGPTGEIDYQVGGTPVIRFASAFNGFFGRSDVLMGWASGTIGASTQPDTALYRASAGTVGTTNLKVLATVTLLNPGTNGSPSIFLTRNANTGVIEDTAPPYVMDGGTIQFASGAWTNADLMSGATTWNCTNRMSANMVFTITNLAGTTNNSIDGVFIADGSDRFVTNVFASIGGTIPVLFHNGNQAAQDSPYVMKVPANTLVEYNYKVHSMINGAITNVVKGITNIIAK